MRRSSAIINPTVRSATAVGAGGGPWKTTVMPRARAADTSIRSIPTPPRPITRSFSGMIDHSLRHARGRPNEQSVGVGARHPRGTPHRIDRARSPARLLRRATAPWRHRVRQRQYEGVRRSRRTMMEGGRARVNHERSAQGQRRRPPSPTPDVGVPRAILRPVVTRRAAPTAQPSGTRRPGGTCDERRQP